MNNRFEKELELIEQGYRVLGVDEVGRGPLAGPVVAAAVNFTEAVDAKWWDQIKDSKKISQPKRELLFSLISEYGDCSVGTASVMEIEKLNILQASLLAMKRAVENFSNTSNLYLLVDGKFVIPNLESRQEAIVKGDQLVHTIAASSIIAKVTRDQLMEEYSKEFPQYGFAEHKGYGTARHIEAIKNFGLTPIHRASFCGNIV